MDALVETAQNVSQCKGGGGIQTFGEGRSKIEAGYLSGDMRKFFVPCPHCGEFQVLLWSQMKWEKSPSGDREVWYECPYCKGKLKNYHKELMLKKASGGRQTRIGYRSG